MNIETELRIPTYAAGELLKRVVQLKMAPIHHILIVIEKFSAAVDWILDFNSIHSDSNLSNCLRFQSFNHCRFTSDKCCVFIAFKALVRYLIRQLSNASKYWNEHEINEIN